MTDIIIAISATCATIVIAIFTGTNTFLSKKTLALTEATHELNKTIKMSADQFQEDMKRLQVELAAAQLYGATNPPGKSLSTERLNELRKFITKDP